MNKVPPDPTSNKNTWLDNLRQSLTASPKDRNELSDILRKSQQEHILDADALAMIEGVMEVSEMQVRDIMIPRANMVIVERDHTLLQIMPVITASAHSRFPVVGDNKDEIIGILLAKDLLTYFINDKTDSFNVRDIIRPAVFIPESKRLNVLLKEFRANRNHMAIVVDEYGGANGLVTIEDVLEQIVGDIEDEHDIEEGTDIMKHSNTHYTIKARTSISDFNEYFNTHHSDEEFDTLGGLLLREFSHLPKRGETINIERFHFRILHADSRRIHLIQLTLTQENTQEKNSLPPSE